MDVRNLVTHSDELLNVIAILLISIYFINRLQQRNTYYTPVVTKYLKTNIKMQLCRGQYARIQH